MKAKPEREVFFVHEIEICVDLRDGAVGKDTKFAVYKTGKNFIRIPPRDPRAKEFSHAKGYGTLMSRFLPVSELMIVKQPRWHYDETDCVRRNIWCLEKDVKKALAMLDAAVDKKVKDMMDEMLKLNKIWETQGRV